MAQKGETSVKKPEMPFETAQALLAGAEKDELVDRAFGDSEGGWCKDGREIAGFYFSRDCRHVWVNETQQYAATTFEEDQARTLRNLGTLVAYDYNDEGRPD